MRGKVLDVEPLILSGGITPAYAGKSQPKVPCHFIVWDHPRVCGEKVRSISGRAALLGSPPRMRGKVYMQSVIRVGEGITPAYAGKSRSHKKK